MDGKKVKEKLFKNGFTEQKHARQVANNESVLFLLVFVF
jgi:hypothetical protein